MPKYATERHRPGIFRGWKYLTFAFLFYIFLFGSGMALSEQATDSLYVRTDFTLDDGLPDNTVEAITQTENGLLWVGTQSGLASFDGKTFTQVALKVPGAAPPSDITSLVEGSDGALWIGTDAGVIRIPREGLADPNLADTKSFRLGAQNSDEVEALMKATDGTIWAGTNHGLYRFDGKQFLCVLTSFYISRIHQGLDGRILLITDHGFLEYVSGRTIEHRGLGARFGVHDDQIFDAFQQHDGTMWYGTNKGLRTVSGARITVPSPWQPAHTSTHRISMGREGTVWLSTGIGIYRISRGELWSPMPGLQARGFYAGKDGDLWIGTNGNGLVHLHRRLAQMYTTANGLPSNNTVMTVLAARDGNLWIGSNCGLSRYNGVHFRFFAEGDGLKNSCVWSLAEDRERNLWIGTYGGGLFRYRNGVFTQYSVERGLASRIVFAVKVVRDGSLWIATPDGLSHLYNNAIRNYTTADGLSSNRILDIHEDHSGTLWVATQGGVNRGAGDRFVAIPSTQPTKEVLPRHFVETSRGDLYTTNTPYGIGQIRNNRLTLLNNTQDLMEMAETPDRTLWFSSRNGVVRIKEQEFGKSGPARPLDFELFTRADGLYTTQASVGSPNIAASSDGKLWVATVKGLAMIDTMLLPRTGLRPKVFISGISTDGASSRIGSKLVLTPGVHHVELTLAAISPANPQKIRLQYLLENVDSGWIEAGASRLAVYTAIPSGSHRMLVRETDTLGNWGPPNSIYEVVQLPQFYATPVFQLSTICAIVLLLALVYLLRVRYMVRHTRAVLEQRQLEREAVARDLHDTFLQGVQGLLLRFHTGTQQLPQDHPVRCAFEEALNQSDQVILEGRTVLSRLRTRRTKPETLMDAYASIGSELRSQGQTRFELIVNGRSRDLDNVVRDELHKIGREALFNTWRHANASRIEVELHFGFFEFRVSFRDDGSGIDSAILRKGFVEGHYGLPGMRERTAKIGGRMRLWSRQGAGTEIEIRIPSAVAYRKTNRSTRSKWIRKLMREQIW